MSDIENQSLPTWNAQLENGLFNTLATAMLAMTLLFSVFISFVELPELSREEKEKLPPQLVKIIKHKVKAPEPKVEPKKEEPKPKPEVKPEPKPKRKEKPKPKRKEKPKPQVAKKVLEKQAKKEAEQSGLLALSEQLKTMRNMAQDSPAVAPGANNALIQGAGAEAKIERVMLGQKATGTSGGVTG